MTIPRSQRRRSIFRMGGGGGGGQKLENGTKKKKIGAQNRNIKLCARSAKWYFYVKFNGFVAHDSAFQTYFCITYY